MSSNSSNEVWLVIDSLTFGGIETHVLELAKGLKRFDVPVKVLFLRRYLESQLLKDKLALEGITTDFLDSEGNYLSTLIHRIRSQSAAVIHAHGYKASLTCKLAKLVTGVRQISTYHAGEAPSGRVWLYDWLDRYSAFVSNHSIAVSRMIARKLISSSVSFNNFIDTQALTLSSGNQVAFVGRLSHEKGPDRFLELAISHHEMCFDMYGSGPLDEELIHSAPANVRFHGHQSDMNSIWLHIGALVICSRYEGLPMTALEAMARGIPVFSLNVGNMPCLIQHQVNGFLVNDVQALGAALVQFHNLSQQEQHTIRQQAIETVNRDFSQSAVIPQLINLYFQEGSQIDCQIEK